jgi:hypothetical protein
MANRRNVARARAQREENVRRQRESGSTKQQAATLFCYIVLITGLGFTVVEMFCAFLGVALPSNATFYAAQPPLIAQILEWAVTSCAMAAQAVTIASVLAFDGSWNHPRWGPQCLGCFIDLYQRRVVDFHIARKKGQATKGRGTSTRHRRRWREVRSKRWPRAGPIETSRFVPWCMTRRKRVEDQGADRVGHRGVLRQESQMGGFRNAWKKHAKIAIKDARKTTVLKGRIELEARIRFYRIPKMDASLDGRRAEWRKTVEHFTRKEDVG